MKADAYGNGIAHAQRHQDESTLRRHRQQLRSASCAPPAKGQIIRVHGDFGRNRDAMKYNMTGVDRGP